MIDVPIVRALLLPSAMRLFGRWNWLPTRVARIFRVALSPLEPAAAPAAAAGWPERGAVLVRHRARPSTGTARDEAAPTTTHADIGDS